MIQAEHCPYKGQLTAPPCFMCTHYSPDTDECVLNHIGNPTFYNGSKLKSYEERRREYQERRNELLTLSKETLVDLILKQPTYYY
jgi:hypothetical protein